MTDMDINAAKNKIVKFISDNAPNNGVVLGVSGGIDSALVLALCVEALGKEKTTALLMPETAENVDETAKQYVEKLGVKYEVIPIKPIVDTYMQDGGVPSQRLVAGNLKARIRMTLLYSRSNAKDLVVMGTGNRSELLTGYFTRYGDGGVDFLPIADLYKTQVWEMAKSLGVPEEIITKAPSAELWPGQTDEQELGITYKKLDRILHEYADKQIPFSDINLPGISKAEIESVQKLVEDTSYKSLAPPICKLTNS